MPFVQWICVDERYPPSKGRYLVCHYRGEDQFNPVQVAIYDPEKDLRKWFGMEPFSVIAGVTHWMRIPAPAKSDK